MYGNYATHWLGALGNIPVTVWLDANADQELTLHISKLQYVVTSVSRNVFLQYV